MRTEKRIQQQRADNAKRYAKQTQEGGLVNFQRRVTPEIKKLLTDFYNKLKGDL